MQDVHTAAWPVLIFGSLCYFAGCASMALVGGLLAVWRRGRRHG